MESTPDRKFRVLDIEACNFKIDCDVCGKPIPVWRDYYFAEDVVSGKKASVCSRCGKKLNLRLR